MFSRLAVFSIRFRSAIVVFWVLAAVVRSRSLPSLSSVVEANNAQFLPSPSQEAAQLAAPFQASNPSGTAILIASRQGAPLTAEDRAAIARVEQAAEQVAGVDLVRDGGTSKDGSAAQAIITLSSATSNDVEKARTAVEAIRATFSSAGAPAGLSLHLTGPLAVTVDPANTNAGAITRLSPILVVVLLFVVYRAVLAPLVTLIPAAVAVVVSHPLIAELAKAAVAVTPVVQQLLIVLLIGAGSDYGLFLIFRMREELGAGGDARTALVIAVERLGEAIAYSALTVGAALITLLLAPFGVYRGLGPAMALGEDYNILVVCRIHEEAHGADQSEALTRAIGITAAGLILAGTLSVFGFAGGGTQAQQLGFSIAFGVLLDTFFVGTLLVPSIARLVGRWNWWPSRLARAR